MGNALRYLYGQAQCCSHAPTTNTTGTGSGDVALGYHGVSSSTVCVSALARHLYHFEITSQLPSSVLVELCQINNRIEGARNYQRHGGNQNLHQHHLNQRPDLEGLLSFYGLPVPYSLDEFIASEAPVVVDGLKFALHTLPVDGKTVPDGDGVNVFVDTTDARESSLVPKEVKLAAVERSIACKQRNYTMADALHKQIIDAGYRVLNIDNEEILARRYRIRLRGIDTPENQQPYWKEAKDELAKIVNGKCLKILVFDEDPYGRFVGDVYCNGLFVQKRMLKKGLAWHYTAYDKRPKLEKWEKDARDKGIGLWALSNPEMPWEWRKNHPESRY